MFLIYVSLEGSSKVSSIYAFYFSFYICSVISGSSEVLPAAKPKQVRQRKRGPAKKEPGLPKNYLMGVFKHFAKTKVSADVYPVLKEM